MEFEQIFQLLTLAAVVLVFYWTNQSFPPGQTAELITELRKASKDTKTPIDDVLVEIAALLNELRTQAGIPATPPADDHGETSTHG